MPWMQGLGRALRALPVCGALWMAPSAGASEVPAASRSPLPPLLAELLPGALDNPSATLADVQRRLVAAPAESEERFWLLLAAARLQLSLEDDQGAAAHITSARQWLPASAAPGSPLAAWLDTTDTRLRGFTEGNVEALKALAAVRSRHAIAAGTALDCDILETEVWVLNAMDSLDEAWRASEALERCAVASGWRHFRATALSERANVAARAGGPGGSPEGAAERVSRLYDEAYAAIGDSPARHQRSLIAYSAGLALTELERPREAEAHFQRALEASRALDDTAGIAAALIARSALDALRGRHREVLQALDEAEPLLAGLALGNAQRQTLLVARRIESLTALISSGSIAERGKLAAALPRAAALPVAGVQPASRARLARAVAQAQALLGQHRQAFESMQQAHALEQAAGRQATGAQVLRLQTLYDNSRREAELAAARHAEESARLSLAAEQATQRSLWLALLAAAALAGGGAALGWRQWLRRREMGELALRDTLTGLPNRRAIEAYAESQLRQALRLKLPLTLALIDLDHFKQVNDAFGHARGDALLRALAAAAGSSLRGPDRLGRWGGEEFLLVLPGTRRAELPEVFKRLRAAFAAAEVAGLPLPHGRSFSMGGAEAGAGSAGSSTLEALLAEADQQLYSAKAAGRDQLA